MSIDHVVMRMPGGWSLSTSFKLCGPPIGLRSKDFPSTRMCLQSYVAAEVREGNKKMNESVDGGERKEDSNIRISLTY